MTTSENLTPHFQASTPRLAVEFGTGMEQGVMA